MEKHFENWKPGDLTAEEFDRAISVTNSTLGYPDIREYPIFRDAMNDVYKSLHHQPFDVLESTFDADGYMYNDFDDYEHLQNSAIRY